MAYVRKIIAKDETLIGIARLHWIYVIKGMVWFFVMAGAGWAMDNLVTRGLMMISNATNTYALPAALLSLSDKIMMFMMAGGFFVFFLFVLKVLVTEVGLTSRRVIHKEGLIFVKVKQIDLEEIRGENMDMGHLGRLLGYAYILLDCRFIGDVKLPAIESPERFIRALHAARSKTQDALSLVVGKGAPVTIPSDSVEGIDSLQVKAQKPTPEIQPGQPAPEPEVNPPQIPQPEIRPEPVPHNPSPQAPPSQPVPPPPQPAQPIPPPINPEPPLQPPSGVSPVVDPQIVAQVVQQVMPQMADQVVKKMTEQGLVVEQPANDENDIDTDLIESFDDARLDKDAHGNDLHNKMEHAIH